jgi:hypothetical protein
VKEEITLNLKAQLLRGAFYLLLLLAVCVIPFALGQRTTGERSTSANIAQFPATSGDSGSGAARGTVAVDVGVGVAPEPALFASANPPSFLHERTRDVGDQFDHLNGAPTDPAGSVYQAWVARYTPPWEADDDVKAIAVDAQGNVYVTGQSWGLGGNYDYATVKYNSAGQQEWATRYDGPDHGNDQANAMAIDSSGNVYVTGSSQTGDSYTEWATIKYDSAGQQLWVARHNICPRSYAFAKAIGVDGSGNLYVTGVDADGWGTIKYNSAGEEQWVAHYNSGTPAAIAIDKAGDVYVTGSDSDYVTINYDSSGQEQWVARYHGPGTGSDHARAVALDGLGNVYVTGASAGSGTASDYATIKYNSAGNQEWVARYDGPAHSDDHAAAIAVDGSDGVYVTGDSVGLGTFYDYATIKYNSAGQQQWATRYNGPGNDQDGATAIAADNSGNSYVTGYSRASFGFNEDYATIKYNSAGQQQWVARYDDGSHLGDFARAIAVDGADNVYVTGQSIAPGTNYDYATIKYGQGPSPTPTATATASPSSTSTATPTASATASPTPTVICSPTPTATSSPTPTPSEPSCPPFCSPTTTSTATSTTPPRSPSPTVTFPPPSPTPTPPIVTPTPSDPGGTATSTPTATATATRVTPTPRPRLSPPPRP